MSLKKFNNFKINEDVDVQPIEKISGETILYRLTSHSVVDLTDPGEFYVSTKEAVSPELLDNKGSDIFLLIVKTDASNIDDEVSKRESESHGNESIVVVKDSSLCSVLSITPY